MNVCPGTPNNRGAKDRSSLSREGTKQSSSECCGQGTLMRREHNLSTSQAGCGLDVPEAGKYEAQGHCVRGGRKRGPHTRIGGFWVGASLGSLKAQLDVRKQKPGPRTAPPTLRGALRRSVLVMSLKS